MERRIRKVEITSIIDGTSQQAFIVNVRESFFEVLALEEGFTFMFFDCDTLTDSTNTYTLQLPQEGQ